MAAGAAASEGMKSAEGGYKYMTKLDLPKLSAADCVVPGERSLKTARPRGFAPRMKSFLSQPRWSFVIARRQSHALPLY